MLCFYCCSRSCSLGAKTRITPAGQRTDQGTVRATYRVLPLRSTSVTDRIIRAGRATMSDAAITFGGPVTGDTVMGVATGCTVTTSFVKPASKQVRATVPSLPDSAALRKSRPSLTIAARRALLRRRLFLRHPPRFTR